MDIGAAAMWDACSLSPSRPRETAPDPNGFRDRVLGMDICISVGPLEQSYILCKHELICYHGTQGKSKREDVQQVSVDSRWLEIV